MFSIAVFLLERKVGKVRHLQEFIFLVKAQEVDDERSLKISRSQSLGGTTMNGTRYVNKDFVVVLSVRFLR